MEIVAYIGLLLVTLLILILYMTIKTLKHNLGHFAVGSMIFGLLLLIVIIGWITS